VTYIKKILYIILIFVFSGCQPNIRNDQKTLNKIFAMEKFDIEISRFGCFGGETDLFELKKVDTEYKLTYLKSKKSIYVKTDSVNSLKNFLKIRLKTPNWTALCTGSMYFRAGTHFNSMDFIDESCQDWDIINQIMNFSAVLKND
jgi:hypothetical protein